MTASDATKPASPGRAHPAHTRGFWDAVDRGELALETCDVCGSVTHPPVGGCRRCGGSVHFKQIDGRGIIYSASEMYYQAIPVGIRRAPYFVAVVDLDDCPGVRMVVPVESPAEVIRPGALVRIEIRETPDGSARVPVAVVVENSDPVHRTSATELTG